MDGLGQSCKSQSGSFIKMSKDEADRINLILATPKIVDTILNAFELEDLKTMQLISKEYYKKVVTHSSTWKERVICIDVSNVVQIANLRPMENWEGAHVKLPIPDDEIRKVEHVLKNVQHLQVTLSSTAQRSKLGDVSSGTWYLFNTCGKLKSLYIDFRIIASTRRDDFSLLRNLVSGLRDFRIMQSGRTYGFFDVNIIHMSTFTWPSLTTLKVQSQFTSIRRLLTPKILGNLKSLQLESTDCIWGNMAFIPHLEHVVVTIPSTCTKYTQLCSGIAKFLLKQPLLTTLTINSCTGDKFPKSLLAVVAARSSQFRELDLNAREFEWDTLFIQHVKTDVSIAFLSELKYLRKLSLQVTGTGHLGRENDVTMFQILSLLQRNKFVTHVTLRGLYHGVSTEHEKVCSKEEWEDKLVRLRRMTEYQFPNLVECKFDNIFYNQPGEGEPKQRGTKTRPRPRHSTEPVTRSTPRQSTEQANRRRTRAQSEVSGMEDMLAMILARAVIQVLIHREHYHYYD